MYANNNVQVIKKKKHKNKRCRYDQKTIQVLGRVDPGDARFSNENNKK